ncbi:hypothetical protein J5N97_010570 [Dioscorea zingiberensis]|uniref:endo-polygalacturonase n=1 Tax=Dioscorea zingiberensis TaxID=325984 RepID=A0A9D5D1H4_9LILI|nr:hypothetical protein J5N97_010570 [Dioscorea zingiberensis]
MVVKELSITLILFLSLCLSCYGTFSNLDEVNEYESCQQRYNITDTDMETEISDQMVRHFKPRLVVNVDDYGAKGLGTDDTKAFRKAWNAVCKSPISAVLIVPERKYLVKPIVFSGPCLSSITVQIKGTIEAPSDTSDWDGKNIGHWILFNGIKNLVVEGGGTIDGKGRNWWENSCKVNKSLPCTDAPTAMTFYSCVDLRVENLRMKNSQKIHLSFEDCSKVQVSYLTIIAPNTSPNTDGIHITRTGNMGLSDCTIKTGDDCISIVSGSRNIRIGNIACGPGHGISIGSLGANNSEGHVANVMVNNVKLTDTSNGVRIKTWQGGHGLVKNILFKNIAMHNVQNPIIIDQNYCDSIHPCPVQKSAVQVRNVMYKNIKGKSASDVAVRLECSSSVPCRKIVLEDIHLVSDGDVTQGLCENVIWDEVGEVFPACAS